MLLGSRINWPRCQMHVKTSLCVAMQLFLPLFGMLVHGTFPLAQALPFHCASAVFCSMSTCVEDGRLENCMSSLHGAAQMRFPTAVRTTE